MNGYERIETLLSGGTPDCLPCMPITMMFAGDFIDQPYGKYASDHRVLVEAQLAVAEEYGFDYVSVISDPGREAADCGANVKYYDNQPPAIDEVNALLADKATLGKIASPDPFAEGSRMLDRIRGAEAFAKQVKGELYIEGWVEGPCAEGADLRGINHLMIDFIDDPAFVRDLFDWILEMELGFARAQIEAGCDIIGIGDAAASLVGPQIYREFVLPYEKRLIEGIQQSGGKVRLHICGNTSRILEEMGTLGAEMVDLDSKAPLSDAREQMGPEQVLAGNIDPVQILRNGTPESIAEALSECHHAAGKNYIVGAGCEVPRDTPKENLIALCEFAHNHRP
jgi:MtaA/CmuA family methyltransferase